MRADPLTLLVALDEDGYAKVGSISPFSLIPNFKFVNERVRGLNDIVNRYGLLFLQNMTQQATFHERALNCIYAITNPFTRRELFIWTMRRHMPTRRTSLWSRIWNTGKMKNDYRCDDSCTSTISNQCIEYVEILIIKIIYKDICRSTSSSTATFTSIPVGKFEAKNWIEKIEARSLFVMPSLCAQKLIAIWRSSGLL